MAELNGIITEIHEIEQVNEGLKKRTFVIEDDTKYHNTVCFELINDKTDIIQYYKVGQKVEVLFSIKSRRHNDRYFASIIAYSVKPL